MRLAFVLPVAAGCAGPRADVRADLPDDPTYGLPKFAEHRQRRPVEETAVWTQWTRVGPGKTLEPLYLPDVPLEAAIERHPSWPAPYERPRSRLRHFVSGFMVGFLARIVYGAVASSGGGDAVTADDAASAILIGAVTGGGFWLYAGRVRTAPVPAEPPGEAEPSR
jgi:hypothetical protein